MESNWTPCLAVFLEEAAVPHLHTFLQMGNIIFPSDEGLGRSRRARKRVNYNMQVSQRTGLTAAASCTDEQQSLACLMSCSPVSLHDGTPDQEDGGAVPQAGCRAARSEGTL